jgi:hypothetical protein
MAKQKSLVDILEGHTTDIPADKEALGRLLRLCPPSLPSDLDGTYYVKMLTGIIPDFSAFGHRKNFRHEGRAVVGENIFWEKTAWGSFRVVVRMWDEGSRTVIDYDTPQNTFSRRIRDTIVTVQKGRLYLGKFHLVICGKPRFIGFFTLTKKG